MMSYRYQRRGLRGLGDCMSSSDIRAALAPQMQNCDPRDSACVLGNQQISIAESNLVDGGCIAPGTPISVQTDTSDAAVQSFLNNQIANPVVTVGGAPDTGVPQYSLTPVFTPQGAAAPTWYNTAQPVGTVTINGAGYFKYADGTCQPNNQVSGARVPCSSLQPASSSAAAPARTPQGQTIVNSSGATTTPAARAPVAAPSITDWFTGSILGGIPNWALAAGIAAVAVVMMGGRR